MSKMVVPPKVATMVLAEDPGTFRDQDTTFWKDHQDTTFGKDHPAQQARPCTRRGSELGSGIVLGARHLAIREAFLIGD
jgi:hypothetical protein